MSLLKICDDPYLLLDILNELPFKDWVSLSNTSSHVRVGVRNAFFDVLYERLLDFVCPHRIPMFFSLLRSTNSVITGALPLSMLKLLEWEPGHDLVLYCPVVSKRKWERRLGWELIADVDGKTESGIHSVQEFCSYKASRSVNNAIKVVYADGPHVLNILAKAPETALSTFLSSWALVTAYPLMMMKQQSYSVIVTRDGQMIGGECLDDFVPVALMDEMPESYTGVRSWKDSRTFVFEYDNLVFDLERMGGNNVWCLYT
ncbi:hypothetical protein K435DRAFT_855070 [Dendrothele bispora CBS 962.96]|uniref:F-box domain-containing protein n=1 Tax=Dendrothele bispora (strain CBS 962.96) TaxID=1314807 RepID=A0A4S8MC58_DENBC|nr:hypothetical protein K435DRAFT_855070 [Dendrothele bispora CBS 962.96]